MLKSVRVLSVLPAPSLVAAAPALLQGMAFVGAFLLFLLEPLAGRLLAPSFGGAVHVWLTSMMFFQAMLLAGYLYAFLLARRLGRWHLVIILLPLLNLPIRLASLPAPEMPVLAVLTVLLTHIALPFAVLATTAIVAQLWLAHSDLDQARNPYPLYASSNAGSLLALVCYPFLLEPWLGLRAQSLLWAAGYFIYLVLVLLAWSALRPTLTAAPSGSAEPAAPAAGSSPRLADYGWWLWLSLLPSAYLLAVTNYIALEVGSFPLIWLVPLALYLASFILTFRTDGGVPLLILALWPVIFLLGLLLYVAQDFSYPQLALALLIFFVVCLYAHGELYERRPPVLYLRHFYLIIALGGWLGGVFVSLVAPGLFSGLFEYPLVMILLGLTIAWALRPKYRLAWRRLSPVLGVSVVLLTGLLSGLLVWIGDRSLADYRRSQYAQRSFYGVYRVVDQLPGQDGLGRFRSLNHGQTRHGGEYLDQALQGQPTTYYYPEGAIGEAFQAIPAPRHIAVVGLGVGTVAAYAKAGDAITFFEIDPVNETIARSYFNFLNQAKGDVRLVTGDGRLSLEQAAKNGQQYHLILIDAFSGDGIPTHLLTREAIQIYLRCLAPQGLLLFHLSNRYYDLQPVLQATAASLDLHGCFNQRTKRTPTRHYDVNPACLALAQTPQALQPLLQRDWTQLRPGLTGVSPWSDDYINIIAPLWANLRAAVTPIKSPPFLKGD